MQTQRMVVVLACVWTAWGSLGHQPSMLPGHGHYPPALGIKLTKENIFDTTNVLNDDMEMSTVVYAGNASSYFYLQGAYGPMNLVIRSCSNSIHVAVYHVHQNSTGYLKDSIQRKSDSPLFAQTDISHVYSVRDAPAGLYLLELVAEQKQAVVTLYATSLPGLPAALRIKQNPRVWIQRRLHRNRITVRWEQSTVDPQLTHYCVVANSRRNFSRLCEAKFAADMNVYVTDLKSLRNENKIHKKSNYDGAKSNKNLRLMEQQLGKDDIFITCVEASLSYTISNLQRGRQYFFNIFAINRQTQLSILYGSIALQYDPKLRPLGLRDNKPVTVNIRRLGGRALFRYKVSGLQKNVSALSWHVMPCGGSVQAEVSVRRRVLVPRLTVHGYRHLQVLNPVPGERYLLTVHVDPDQMKQMLGVEVLATTRMSPLPLLPSEISVHEYPSLRTCDSVTVGWVAAAANLQTVRYCVSASPVPATDTEDHFRPRANQCNLDHKLRSQADFAIKHCQDFSANDHRNVLVQSITKLRPGKAYIIQVTVKKIKGKALSYDLLRVRTKSRCSGLH